MGVETCMGSLLADLGGQTLTLPAALEGDPLGRGCDRYRCGGTGTREVPTVVDAS